MKVELSRILYTVIMVILAFIAAVVVTKTLSKWLKLEEKANRSEDIDKKE